MPSPFQPLEDAKAIHARHLQVQQQQTWPGIIASVSERAVAVQISDRLRAVPHDEQLVGTTRFLKRGLHQERIVSVVFGYKNMDCLYHALDIVAPTDLVNALK